MSSQINAIKNEFSKFIFFYLYYRRVFVLLTLKLQKRVQTIFIQNCYVRFWLVFKKLLWFYKLKLQKDQNAKKLKQNSKFFRNEREGIVTTWCYYYKNNSIFTRDKNANNRRKIKKRNTKEFFFKNSEDIKIFNSINKCVDYLKELKEIRKEDERAAINILEKLQVDFQEEEQG